MKKILLFGLTALSTFALMGCDMIAGLFEKSYNYNDFKALLADRKLSWKVTKGSAEIDKDVNDLFKFYAKGDAYRITAEYKTDDEQIKLEYKYGADGLVTYRYNKTTDLKSVKTTEKKINYTYSE